MSGFRSGQGGGSPTDLKPRNSVTIQGTNPKVTIGDAGEEDTMLLFDGNAVDFHVALDDSADELIVGRGATAGTNPVVKINSSGQITQLGHQTSPTSGHYLKWDGSKAVFAAVSGEIDGSIAANNISTGNAAVSLATSSDNITIDSQAGSVSVDGHTGLTLTSSNSGEVDITSAANIDINATTTIDIDAADEITIDTTSADGHIAITSAHTAGQSILISANANAGSILDIDAGELDVDIQTTATIDAVGIALGAGSGELDLTTTGTLDVNANALDMDLTDSSSITITSSEAAEDLTIEQVGANDSSIIVKAAGTGSDAIKLNTSAGSIDIDSADNITIDAADDITVTADNFNVSGLFKVATTDAQTTGGQMAIFEGVDGSGPEVNRISINVTSANQDTGISFMDNSSTKWTIGNDGSTDDFHMRVGYGVYGVTDEFILSSAGKMTLLNDTASSATQGAAIRLVSDDGALMGDGHRLGVIEFAGAEAGGNAVSIGARIEALARDAWGADDNDANLLFYTTNGTTESEVLKLDADKLATFAGNLTLLSDSAVLSFGADSDVTLTHVHNTGLLINSDHQLQFRDSAISISSGADGNMAILADSAVSITTTTVLVGPGDGNATLTSKGAHDLILNTNSGTNSGTITITDAADGDITLAPNGTGKVAVGSGSGAAYLMSNGTQDLVLVTSGTGPTLTLTDGTNGGITLEAHGTGDVNVSADTLRIGDQNGNATLTTWGTGDLTLSTNGGTNSGTITIADGSNGNMSFTTNGEGAFNFKGGGGNTSLYIVDDDTTAWGGGSYTVPVIMIAKSDGAAPSNGEMIGEVHFRGTNAGSNEVPYSIISATAADGTTNSEKGNIEIQVQTIGADYGSNFYLTTGFKLEGSTGTIVDATIGNHASSTTTTAGGLTVTSDLTVNGGDITFSNAQNSIFNVAPTAAGTAGKSLTVAAGTAATAGSNNTNGGNLVLKSGGGDGTGTSEIQFWTKTNGTDAATEKAAIAADGSLKLFIDGGAIKFGDDHDVTLTHVHDTGLLLNAAMELQFRDSALTIGSSGDGQLDIDADTELEIVAPTLDIDASTAVTITSPAVTIDSSGDGDPLLTLKTTHTTKTSSAELQFKKDAANVEDAEVLGQITFYGENDAGTPENILYGKITGYVSDHADGDEGGKITIGVATHDGEFKPGVIVEDGSAEDEVDVTLGFGAGSIVLCKGGIQLTPTTGNNDMDGGGAVTMDNTRKGTLTVTLHGTWANSAGISFTLSGNQIKAGDAFAFAIDNTGSSGHRNGVVASAGAVQDGSVIITLRNMTGTTLNPSDDNQTVVLNWVAL